MLSLFDAHLSSPAAPVLTVYDEHRGFRMDFSAITLDNWAAKTANFLYDELDLAAGDAIAVDLPCSWQRLVVVLGACAAQVKRVPREEAEVCFVDADAIAERGPRADVEEIAVAIDGFGRSAAACGLDIGAALDFNAEVRGHGDAFFGATRPLGEMYPGGEQARIVLSDEHDDWEEAALAAIGAGGSAVVVAGSCSDQRLQEIADSEKATLPRRTR